MPLDVVEVAEEALGFEAEVGLGPVELEPVKLRLRGS